MEFKKGQEYECILNCREARIGDVGRWVSDKIFHLNDEYYTINELFDFNKYFRLLDPMVYGVEVETPQHYDNSKGSIYEFCENQKLNSYEFDIIKRVVRCRKKGNWLEDLNKTKHLIDLYINEYEKI